VLGRFVPVVHDLRLHTRKIYQDTLRHAAASKADIYLANDWSALPVCAEAARRNNAALVLDEHEFAPAMYDTLYYRLLFGPMTRHFLKEYIDEVDGFTTVCEPIAERYGKEFGLRPMVVMNAPERTEAPYHDTSVGEIKLVHHGLAARDRHLEWMIEAVAKTEAHFTLHFHLVGDAGYIEELRTFAQNIAAARVFFHDPVDPSEIVNCIAGYDVGFCVIAPTNYNYLISLPNKFFDYVVAGLAFCIGPSPAMSVLVNQYGFGVIAPTFTPEDLAQTLNGLTVEKINAMKAAAREASKVINADVEVKKLVDLAARVSRS